MTKVYDRATANRIGQILCRHARVEQVLLFGSIARNGTGRDVDLILIADRDARAMRFLDLVEEYMRLQACSYARAGMPVLRSLCSDPYSLSSMRLRVMHEVLRGEIGYLCEQAEMLAAPGKLDIFIFPSDWRDHLHVLQGILKHRDTAFMENIARDAVVIARRMAFAD